MPTGRLRILQVAPCWFAVPPTGYGGIERVVHLVTEELVARGHDVVLAASGGSRTTARLLSHHERPPTSRLGERGPELEHLLATWLADTPVDVVHDHTGVLGAAVAAVAGVPTVHTVHNGWRDEELATYRLLGDTVDLLTVSHSEAALAPAGIRVAGAVPNAVDAAAIPFVAEPDDALAFVGRASPDKGVLDAIEVARRLDRSLRVAIKVNQPDEQDYWRDAVRPALRAVDADVVVNADERTALATLARAAVALVPARWDEPFGLVAAEALAGGTPVAGYRRGAVPEVVIHRVTGVLVREGDVAGLVAATLRAAAIDRATCRADVVRRFSVEGMTDGYERAYAAAIRRRRREPAGVAR